MTLLGALIISEVPSGVKLLLFIFSKGQVGVSYLYQNFFREQVG